LESGDGWDQAPIGGDVTDSLFSKVSGRHQALVGSYCESDTYTVDRLNPPTIHSV
jgi:hypothetical protein